MNAVNILPPSPLLCSALSNAGSEQPQRPSPSGRRCSLPEQAKWMQMWLLITEHMMVVMIFPYSGQFKTVLLIGYTVASEKRGVLTLFLSISILLQETHHLLHVCFKKTTRGYYYPLCWTIPLMWYWWHTNAHKYTQAFVWRVGPFFCHLLTGCVGMIFISCKQLFFF